MFKKTCSFKLVSFAKVVCFVVCKCCLQTLQIGFVLLHLECLMFEAESAPICALESQEVLLDL